MSFRSYLHMKVIGYLVARYRREWSFAKRLRPSSCDPVAFPEATASSEVEEALKHHGQHVCFIDGGLGNDIMNWVVSGENSGEFQCTAQGGAGDDQVNLVLGTAAEETSFTGTVEYLADTGSGNDTWNATVNFTADSDGVVSPFTVLLGADNDTAILNFIQLGHVQVFDGFFSGGPGVDAYIGPPPIFLSFPVEDFEIGV
jgi:hypothetical protein